MATIKVNPRTSIITIDGQPVTMYSRRLGDILWLLMVRSRVTISDIIDYVYSGTIQPYSTNKCIHIYICNLNKILKEHGWYIKLLGNSRGWCLDYMD